MTEILHELWVQMITVLFMSGVIVTAVIFGRRFRNYMDRKKLLKEEKEERGGAES